MCICLQLTFITRHISMKNFLINKCSVELTKESITSFINSKVNSCGREVRSYECVHGALVVMLVIHKHETRSRNRCHKFDIPDCCASFTWHAKLLRIYGIQSIVFHIDLSVIQFIVTPFHCTISIHK